PSLLPSDPVPNAGDLRVVSGLPDGGVVAAGRSVILVRDAADQAFTYADQPIEGIAVAVAAIRRADGQIGALVSVAPPAAADPSGERDDAGGFPPGDGELLRQTPDGGWQDLSLVQWAGGASVPGDGTIKPDPVLAVASSASGDHVWAVGGYAGTVTSAGQGTTSVLSARPAGWRTASVWRFDAGTT